MATNGGMNDYKTYKDLNEIGHEMRGGYHARVPMEDPLFNSLNNIRQSGMLKYSYNMD